MLIDSSTDQSAMLFERCLASNEEDASGADLDHLGLSGRRTEFRGIQTPNSFRAHEVSSR